MHTAESKKHYSHRFFSKDPDGARAIAQLMGCLYAMQEGTDSQDYVKLVVVLQAVILGLESGRNWVIK